MGNIKLPEKVTRAIGKVGFELKKHAPEILVVTGVVGTVASAVLACKATTKLEGILDKTKKDIAIIDECLDCPEGLPEPYTKEDAKKDKMIVYARTGLDLAKLYGPSLALGALSITCILASNNVLRKRSVGMAAAYTAVDTSFKEYRQRVVDRFGEELDKELRYNIKAKEVEEEVVDENGNVTVEKKTVYEAEINDLSDYARFFDATCEGYTKNAEFNLMFLKRQQDFANDMLRARGYLFLNDVYELLGFNKTQAGQQVGWWYDEKHPTGANFVDFGIYKKDGLHNNSRFVNGLETVCIIDPNVDGNILYHFEK